MKSLIIYYSYGGNTKRIVDMIQNEIDADVVEIKTVKPYTGSYNDVVSQGKREIESGFLPDIVPIDIGVDKYDVVVIGSPVWWYTFAPAMHSFLKNIDLSGKTVYPFATNGGWLGHTLKDFAKECINANVKEGIDIRFDEHNLRTSEKDIKNWIKTIK